jgi:hypothetical protein
MGRGETGVCVCGGGGSLAINIKQMVGKNLKEKDRVGEPGMDGE